MTRTLADQSRAAMALAALTTEYPDLPAVEMLLPGGARSRVTLSLHQVHSTLADFEPWREALRIPERAVSMSTFDQTLCLVAEGVFDGVTVELIAYGPLLATVAPEPASLKAVA